MKKALVVIIILAIFSCKKEDLAEEKAPGDCVEKIDKDKICTQQYDPVCGCNKKTYGNACTALAAGIPNYTLGECAK